MTGTTEYIREWAALNIKNKDLYFGRIESIKEEKDEIITKNKGSNDEITYSVMPTLHAEEAIKAGQKSKFANIITLNNPENIKELAKNWKKIIKFQEMNVWFVNPLSGAEKKWVIKPYVHDKICDPASLESGLKAMAENVEFITEQELMKKI